jgi:hypothetical protein
MMDILLTPEEQENAANRGPDDDWTNICRAQVLKVVEWLKKNNVAGQCYDSDLVDKWDLMLASEVWEELQLFVFHITEREETRQRMAALREAAGSEG